jgi:hypothetical protein
MSASIKAGLNNDMHLMTDGVTRAYIDSDGNVGIGTDLLSGQLHVKASSGFAEVYTQGSNSASGMYLFDQGVESGLWKVDSGQLAFGTTNTMRMKIDSTGRVTTPSQPSFNAQRTSNQGIQGGTTLIFDQARHNTGNHYNTSTGVFTAPIAGDYLFTFKSLFYAFSASEYLDLYSTVNGTTRNRYEQTGNSGQHTEIDYTEVVRLNANDTFYLFANNRNSGATLYSMYGNENHFSGYLLG